MYLSPRIVSLSSFSILISDLRLLHVNQKIRKHQLRGGSNKEETPWITEKPQTPKMSIWLSDSSLNTLDLAFFSSTSTCKIFSLYTYQRKTNCLIEFWFDFCLHVVFYLLKVSLWLLLLWGCCFSPIAQELRQGDSKKASSGLKSREIYVDQWRPFSWWEGNPQSILRWEEE